MVPPSGYDSVAMLLNGAPLKVSGEKTITEFIDSDCQLMVRKLAMRAVTSRPSTLTVIVSPSASPSCLPISSPNETNGGPS